jgi:hypothetical protein
LDALCSRHAVMERSSWTGLIIYLNSQALTKIGCSATIYNNNII